MRVASTIAEQSFILIRAELQAHGYTFEAPMAAIIERVIHSTADFEFATLIQAMPNAVEAGISALCNGCAVVTDVRMVQVGISAHRLATLGGRLHCFVADEETHARAATDAITRAAMGIRRAAEAHLIDGSIIAVGNAPTALLEILRLIAVGARPALVIGVPVGFVNTVESKIALRELSQIPWITTVGRKGGSSVAVAIINALLRLATGTVAEDTD